MDRATSLPPPVIRLPHPYYEVPEHPVESYDLAHYDVAHEPRWPQRALDTSDYLPHLLPESQGYARTEDGRAMYAHMTTQAMHHYHHGPVPPYPAGLAEPKSDMMYTHASGMSDSNDALTIDPRHFFGGDRLPEDRLPSASSRLSLSTKLPLPPTDALAAPGRYHDTAHPPMGVVEQTPFILPPAYTAHLPPELHDIALSGQQGGSNSAPTSRATSPSRKRGARFEPTEIILLRQAFAQNPQPNHDQYMVIAKRLGVPLKKVHTWFQCQRAKYRKANTPYPVPVQIFFPTMQRVQVAADGSSLSPVPSPAEAPVSQSSSDLLLGQGLPSQLEHFQLQSPLPGAPSTQSVRHAQPPVPQPSGFLPGQLDLPSGSASPERKIPKITNKGQFADAQCALHFPQAMHPSETDFHHSSTILPPPAYHPMEGSEHGAFHEAVYFTRDRFEGFEGSSENDLHGSSVGSVDDSNQEGSEGDNGQPGKRNRSRRAYHRFTPQDLAILRSVFQATDQMPSMKVQQVVAEELKIPVRTIQVWFQNERAKQKRRGNAAQQRQRGLTITKLDVSPEQVAAGLAYSSPGGEEGRPFEPEIQSPDVLLGMDDQFDN